MFCIKRDMMVRRRVTYIFAHTHTQMWVLKVENPKQENTVENHTANETFKRENNLRCNEKTKDLLIIIIA